MMLLRNTIKTLANGQTEIESPTRIARETMAQHKGRPVCVELTVSGVKVWLKGKRDFYVVPYDVLFIDGERGSVSIPGRKVSDRKMMQAREAAAANRITNNIG